MVNKEILNKYIPTIGIECHVQFSTNTKLFSAVQNDARDAKPNTLISHIDLGLPGALPVLNEQAVEYAMRAAFALGTEPQKYSKFDRKHYFYPDLPMGYQITQFYNPIIKNGEIYIEVEGKKLRIGIHEAHLEADAGKSTHPAGKDYSLVDYNRAGTPLLEIVSEPDMHTSAEAKAYAKELYLRMRYIGVSDANLFYGNMRFDVNVSVSRDKSKLGTRTETKNINSFKSVEKTVDYEINRQIELLENGKSIVQETRGWDDAKQKTFSQRTKEDAHDYRYMPDPDLPPIELSQTAIESVRAAMPMLPSELKDKLSHIKIDESAINTLIEEIPAGKLISELIDNNVDEDKIKKIANWLVSDVQALVGDNEDNWDKLKLNPNQFVQLATMALENQISSTGAKDILKEMIISNIDPMTLAKNKNILQQSDESELSIIVSQVIENNPNVVKDIGSGETKAIGYLVGQVMKASHGKANPAIAQKIIKKILS